MMILHKTKTSAGQISEKRTMLKKIISGGQVGAEQAALDVAINLGISHGGWISKAPGTKVGALPNKYKLKEISPPGYLESTEQNVIDSDATLVISRGGLTEKSLFILKFAKQHKKEFLHIDLEINRGFSAAQLVKSWIAANKIQVLNVSGPSASNDQKIYEDTVSLLKAVNCLFHLNCCESSFI